MAYSTQQLFFFLPCMRIYKNYQSKDLCLQLREYNTIYDDRSWSLDEQKQSHYFQDILRCTAKDFVQYIKKSQDISKDSIHFVWNTMTVKNVILNCIIFINAKLRKFGDYISNIKSSLTSVKSQEQKNERNIINDLYKNINLLIKKYDLDDSEKDYWKTVYESNRNLFENHEKLVSENKYLRNLLNSIEHSTIMNSVHQNEPLNTVRIRDKSDVKKVETKLQCEHHNQIEELQKEKEKLENEINTLKAQLRDYQLEAHRATCLQLENDRLSNILKELVQLERECQNIKINCM